MFKKFGKIGKMAMIAGAGASTFFALAKIEENRDEQFQENNPGKKIKKEIRFLGGLAYTERTAINPKEEQEQQCTNTPS